jgi:predicted PurR-regulated permease PerM
MESLVALISPLLRPLTTTGIVAIFVVFILLQREDLRNRFIKLAGTHDLQKTTAALDDGGRRLSRLFLFQLILNGCFGLVIGTGLWLIGVPSAILWGILSAGSALCSLCRRRDLGDLSTGSCRGRRPGLEHVAVDRGPVPYR